MVASGRGQHIYMHGRSWEGGEEKNPLGGGRERFFLSLSEAWEKGNKTLGKEVLGMLKHLLSCCHVVGCRRLECTLVLIKPSWKPLKGR